MKAGTQSVLPHRFYWVQGDTGERQLRCDICNRNGTRLKIITELEPKNLEQQNHSEQLEPKISNNKTAARNVLLLELTT